MHNFHGNYLKKKYDTKAKLLLTDTSSLTNEIETDDVYEFRYADNVMFYLFEYSKNSKFYEKTNKNVAGKMKDRTKGVPFNENVGLKSRKHSSAKENGKDYKKGKGINKNVVRCMNHKEYKNVHFVEKQIRH